MGPTNNNLIYHIKIGQKVPMCYSRHIVDVLHEVPATERQIRAPAALGWENNVPGIRQTDLQELIAYLEKCSRHGEGADLPEEWARQLLLVLNATGDVLPAKAEPLIDLLECDLPRRQAPRLSK